MILREETQLGRFNLDDEFQAQISEETWKRLLPLIIGKDGFTTVFNTHIGEYEVEETVTIRLIPKPTLDTTRWSRKEA